MAGALLVATVFPATPAHAAEISNSRATQRADGQNTVTGPNWRGPSSNRFRTCGDVVSGVSDNNGGSAQRWVRNNLPDPVGQQSTWPASAGLACAVNAEAQSDRSYHFDLFDFVTDGRDNGKLIYVFADSR